MLTSYYLFRNMNGFTYRDFSLAKAGKDRPTARSK